MDEKVLCILSELDARFMRPGHGEFIPVDEAQGILNEIAKSKMFIARSICETDETFLQVIPYVIVKNGDKVLRYRRGKAGGESRLHDLYSIGIGGHISEEDESYTAGLKREVEEEIGTKNNISGPLGLISDKSTPVGRVHLGVVHVVDCSNENIIGVCKSIESDEFVSLDELTSGSVVYENWSVVCIENIKKILS